MMLEEIIYDYYADNAKKLRKIVDRILLKFGGLSGKDMDDFYSLANEVFASIIGKYDESYPFEALLYTCLCNKIKSEINKRNRYKRQADRLAVSIDTPVGDDENCTIGDMIADSFDLEKEVIENGEDAYNEKMLLYLNRLSIIQKEILKLIIAGYNSHEIQEKLHISEKEYSDGQLAIHSYRNISILF